MEKGKGVLAGRGLASGPLAEAGPADQRIIPSPRYRPHRHPRAYGRAVTPWRADRARPPRGAHAPGWTHPGQPLGVPGSFPTASCASPLSLSHPLLRPRAAATHATARHCRRRSEHLSPAALAFPFESAATNNSTSPSRSQRALNRLL